MNSTWLLRMRDCKQVYVIQQTEAEKFTRDPFQLRLLSLSGLFNCTLITYLSITAYSMTVLSKGKGLFKLMR